MTCWLNLSKLRVVHKVSLHSGGGMWVLAMTTKNAKYQKSESTIRIAMRFYVGWNKCKKQRIAAAKKVIFHFLCGYFFFVDFFFRQHWSCSHLLNFDKYDLPLAQYSNLIFFFDVSSLYECNIKTHSGPIWWLLTPIASKPPVNDHYDNAQYQLIEFLLDCNKTKKRHWRS